MYTFRTYGKTETAPADVEKARQDLGFVGKGVIAIGMDDGEGGFELMELESFSTANVALANFGLEQGTNLADTAQKLVDLRNNPPPISEPAADPTERIAAALEFQSMMLL